MKQRSVSLFIVLVVLAMGSSVAQAADAGGDGMEFPRNALNWFLNGDAERLWSHAGPTFREMMQDVEGVRQAGAEIGNSLGREVAVLDEQVIDHPDGEGWQVYVRTVHLAGAGELFWVLIFSPSEREIGMIMPQSRPAIRTFFPEARLP